MKHGMILALFCCPLFSYGHDLRTVEWNCAFSAPQMEYETHEQIGRSQLANRTPKFIYRVTLGESTEQAAQSTSAILSNSAENRTAVIQKGFINNRGEFVTTAVRVEPVLKTQSLIQGVTRVEYRSERFELVTWENHLSGETRVFLEDGGLEVSSVGGCEAVSRSGAN